MDDMLAPELEVILRRYVGGGRVLKPDDRLYQDLLIHGDDAVELLQEVHAAFGTTFHDFDFRRYFPPEGEGSALEPLLSKVKFLTQWKPLTVRHLADVIEHGSWFEPAEHA